MREGFRPEQALKLTETQSASWDQLHRQHREALRPLFEKGRGLHDQIRRQLESSKPDPTALGKLMISAHALHGQREAARKDLDEKLAQILDPEQKAKWDLMKEMRGGQRDGWGHGMPMGPRGPMGPDADEPEPPDSE
jgi:Spy/CpxP family protein refolding chaperone